MFPGRLAGVDADAHRRGPQPELVGRRVRLRPWRAEDAPAVLAVCRDAALQRWTEVPVPYLPRHAEDFVGPIATSTWAGGGGLFAVEKLADGGLVGSIPGTAACRATSSCTPCWPRTHDRRSDRHSYVVR